MSQAKPLNIDFVRSQFPGLNEWALFENAGGTLVPQSVIERIGAYMTRITSYNVCYTKLLRLALSSPRTSPR